MQRKSLLVGVGRHLQGVLKKDHSLGGDLLSQLFQKTRGMNALPFRKLHKLLLRGPRSVFPLNKPLGDKSMYYRRRREDESRYLVARKGYWILAPHQCENVGLLIFVEAALTQVVWKKSKPWRYYAELTWTSFGSATLQQFMECWAMKRKL